MLPDYRLQVVDEIGAGVMLYYSDKTLCPLCGGPLEEVQHGTVVVEIVPIDSGISNGNWTAQTFHGAVDGAIFYEPQMLKVKGQDAVAWEAYNGQSIATIDGDVISEEHFPLSGRYCSTNEKS